jgi:hypothetical protein
MNYARNPQWLFGCSTAKGTFVVGLGLNLTGSIPSARCPWAEAIKSNRLGLAEPMQIVHTVWLINVNDAGTSHKAVFLGKKKQPSCALIIQTHPQQIPSPTFPMPL